LNAEPTATVNIHVIDELKVGGAQTHLVTVLREIVRCESPSRHLVVSLFGGGGIEDDLRQLGIEVQALDFRDAFQRRRFLEPSRSLLRIFRERRPQLVTAHLTWSRLLGLYAAWRAGVPVRLGFEQGDLYLSSLKFRAANFAGQFFAHRMIVCSRALGDWVHKTHRIRWKKLAVLHNCVDLQLFNPERHQRRQREAWAIPPERTLFCAAGTLGRGVNKRVDVCIKAVARARMQGADVGLVICGDGEQRSGLEALARQLGISDYVLFLGMRRDLPAILSACDAFCHGAPFEPFGIVCIEAMAMELPVVVPRTGGIAEAVEDGITGYLYPPLDDAALGAAMSTLHKDPGKRREMGRAGRRRVEREFSVAEYVNKFRELAKPQRGKHG